MTHDCHNIIPSSVRPRCNLDRKGHNNNNIIIMPGQSGLKAHDMMYQIPTNVGNKRVQQIKYACATICLGHATCTLFQWYGI